MIKKFENFVNEGFIENILNGIDAGIGAFKVSRNAERAADEELYDILDGRSDEFSNKVKMTALVKQLVERSAMLADGFSYDKLVDSGYDIDIMVSRLKTIEEVISNLKALMIEDFNVRF